MDSVTEEEVEDNSSFLLVLRDGGSAVYCGGNKKFGEKLMSSVWDILKLGCFRRKPGKEC